MSADELNKFEEDVLGVDVAMPAVELVKVDDIKLDGFNPNKMESKQFTALKENIKKFGFIVPLITNKDLVVADGEHRFLAAKDLGMKEVPVFRLDVSEVDRRILRQVLNKLKGEHDKRLDFEEFKFLFDNNALNSLESYLGSEDKFLVQFVAGLQKPNLNPDVVPDLSMGSVGGVSEVVKVEKGDLWKLGDHFLLCGDATSEEDVKRLVGDLKVDMVFTDPPYNVNYSQYKFGHKNTKDRLEKIGNDGTILNDSMSPEKFKVFLESSLRNMFLVNRGSFYVCMSNKEITTLMNIFESLGGHWSSTIIWNKSSFVLGRQDYHRKYEPILYGFAEPLDSDFTPILYGWPEGSDHYYNGDRGQSDVWDIDKPVSNDLHPTMKPVALIERAVTNSTRPGMVVLDCFGGSGSTLIACERLSRRCLMLELDEHFCSVIIHRWQNLTNKKAEKV
jgi:DNA modification methylase